MRRSIAIAAALAAAGGATALGADDVPVQWFGSDTLSNVTVRAIDGAVSTNELQRYLVGGPGAGQSKMANDSAENATQQTAPMGEMLTSGACTFNLGGNGNNGAFTTNANGIVIGLDAVSILSSMTSGSAPSCSSPASNTVTNDGLAFSGSAVFGPSGTATAPNQNWKYVLALVYGGLDITTGTVDCNSAARRNLVNNWSNLFQNHCSNGNAVCSASVGITGTGDGIHAGQLMHAFRPDDASDAADVFASILGLQVLMPSSSASRNNGFGQSAYCNALNWDTSNVNNGGGFCNLGGHDQFVGPGGIPDPQSACTFFSFKPGDLAGTSPTPNDTDTGCVAGTPLNGVPATLAGVTGTVHRMPPPNTLGAVPLAGSHNGSDVLPTSFQDNDPIRRPCLGATGKTAASGTGGAAFSPGESVGPGPRDSVVGVHRHHVLPCKAVPDQQVHLVRDWRSNNVPVVRPVLQWRSQRRVPERRRPQLRRLHHRGRHEQQHVAVHQREGSGHRHSQRRRANLPARAELHQRRR
jgi:hypothetical protein